MISLTCTCCKKVLEIDDAFAREERVGLRAHT